MSLIEIDLVIRLQSNDLSEGTHARDVGCFARRSFMQKMMPILVTVITFCIIGFQCTYMHAKDALSLGLTFTIMQGICAVMFYSTGFWHDNERVRASEEVTVQRLLDFAKDCLLGALFHWILYLPPILYPILTSAFMNKTQLAVQTVLVLILICVSQVSTRIAYSAKQMIERSLRARRFNETKRIINSAIIQHVICALVLLALFLLVIDIFLVKRLHSI